MQLTKPCFSMYAEDFGLMKHYLSAEEIIEMLTALQDLCIFGESEYQPKNPKQQYCWDKLKKKFDVDLVLYRTSVENGKKGGRPKKDNLNNNPKETRNKTCDKTHEETHLTLDTCLPDSCVKFSLNSNLINGEQKEKKKFSGEFDEFWRLYPKQRAGSKDKAFKAYLKALAANKTTHEHLMRVVKVYANSKEVEAGYACGCERWFNDEKYNNAAFQPSQDEIYIRHGIEYRGQEALYWKSVDADREAYNGRA